MSAWTAAHERAIAEGVCRAFSRRAAGLRRQAGELTTTVVDRWGREVAISSPEAVMKARTAAILDECATDVAGMVKR